MRTYYYLIFTVLLVACTSPKWTMTQLQGSKIVLDASIEPKSDADFKVMLLPYKQMLDARMNEVIGNVDQNMRAHKPESLLSNWSADVYLQSATAYLGQPVDVAIVNLGGLRTQISAGPLTVRKVFELMPFENELVLLWLKGSDLEDLLQFFARIGGQGVGGLRMQISGGKATGIEVGGKPLDPNRTYIITTNDYLAEGNDYMSALTRHTKRVNTGILVRNMLMDYIRKENAAGRTIKSQLDGRISTPETSSLLINTLLDDSYILSLHN